MKLIPFDEKNEKHMKAFRYFAYEAGHPEYLCNGLIADSDFDFREILSKKFKLDECFVEEPNGCSHELFSRILDTASFNAYYGTDNDQNGYDEVGFYFDGKLFFNEETEKVILEPIIDTIKMVSEIR